MPSSNPRPSRERVDAPDRRILPSFAAGAVDAHRAVTAFDEQVTRDTSWAPHSHPTHELLWNERGVSTVAVGDRVWTVTPVLGVWMPAGVVHSASASAGTWYRANQFDIDRAPALAEGVAVVEITPLLRLLLLRLTEPLPDASRTLAERMVVDVLVPARRAISVTVPSSPLLTPIVDALRRDPADGRSLEQWAAELGVGVKTVTRAFRDETGLPFSKWIAAARMQDAVYLLGGGASVDEVAEIVGYSTVSAFGAAFKRVTGVSPGQFRSGRFATT